MGVPLKVSLKGYYKGAHRLQDGAVRGRELGSVASGFRECGRCREIDGCASGSAGWFASGPGCCFDDQSNATAAVNTPAASEPSTVSGSLDATLTVDVTAAGATPTASDPAAASGSLDVASTGAGAANPGEFPLNPKP